MPWSIMFSMTCSTPVGMWLPPGVPIDHDQLAVFGDDGRRHRRERALTRRDCVVHAFDQAVHVGLAGLR